MTTTEQAVTAERPNARRWDLLIIGGGTAGIVGARTGAQLGARVLLVEENRTGGDCLWTGCVPSKALLAAAHTAADARAAWRVGIDVDGVRVDFSQVRRHVQAAIDAIEPTDDPDTLAAAGVQVVQGHARFTGPDRVEVTSRAEGTTTIRFRRALIASGAAPAIPPIPGLDTVDMLTSDTVWDLPALPERLLVLGGGSIGCELGQAFARLGSRVTLVEARPRILPQESPEAATVVADALRLDGVDLRLRARVQYAARRDGGVVLRLDGGRELDGEALLVATGRRARTDGLGLSSAGIATTTDNNVRVDAVLRTSNPRVYAAGDVTAHPRFTHVAGSHGSVAASNAILGLHRRAETVVIPRVTFTQPEVAAFGVRADQAAVDRRLQVRTVRHDRLDRAVAEDRTDGYSQLVVDRRDRIVGATIVGPRAGESLPELILAARHGLRARDVAATIHPYPTYGDGPWRAGIEQVQGRLTSGAVGLLIATLRHVQRWRGN